MSRFAVLLLLACAVAADAASVGGVVSPDGKERMQCPLPGRFHQKNSVGSDGSGLCVFASMKHSGIWGSDPVFTDLFQWMKRHPGGGYPSKVDDMLKRYCKEKGVPLPNYVQSESNDLAILKLATRNGMMPGVTYGRSPTGRYGGGHVSHMVSLTHATDNWFAVLDNNYPGEDRYEWMTPDEFWKVCNGGGRVWSVFPIGKVPPPSPKNGGDNVAMLRCLICAATLLGPATAGAPPARCMFGCSAVCMCGCNDGKGCRCAGRSLGDLTTADVSGVDAEKCCKGEPKYMINGVVTSKRGLMDAIDPSKVRDDSKKRQIVIIGPEAKTAEAAKAIGKPEWAVVSVWTADDWRVKERDFKTDGEPTIYVLEPDGTVFHRQDDLDGCDQIPVWGDPKYDPTKDPNRKPILPPIPIPPIPVVPVQPEPSVGGLSPAVAGGLAGGAVCVLLLIAYLTVPVVLKSIRGNRDDLVLALRLLQEEKAKNKQPQEGK